MNDQFDELDRAIFALPLATPPAGLRGAILRATVHAPRLPSVVPFSRVEIVGIGFALALAAWLLVAAIVDYRFTAAITEDAHSLVRLLIDPNTLAWTMLGAGIAALSTLVNLRPQRRGSRRL